MGMLDKYTCRCCKKQVPGSQIVSFSENDRWFETCARCVANAEYEELQADIRRNKEEKERRAKIAKEVQQETRRYKAPQDARAAAEKKIESFEEAQKEIDVRRKAQQELAQRELCRRHLLHYIQRFKPDYRAGWVHQVICHKLEQFLADVRAKKAPRLALFMPPRHGKSEIVSNNFPSWALGKYPNLEIMLSSYAVTLATDFSKANRDRIKDSRIYHQLFEKTRVNPKSEGAEYWRTTAGGGFLAAGVGGPITGRGADIFIVDDPVKNYEEAESETVREATKNWWRSTARTRLSPGGGVLVIQTRWHDDDLSGFLEREYIEGMKEGIPEAELEKYEIISFPAEAEDYEYLDSEFNLYKDKEDAPKDTPITLVRSPGEPLHPERWTLEYLRQTRRTMGERLYGALYQQNPVPDSGDFFRIEDFRYYNIPPHLGPRPVYFSWDFAVSSKQSGDFNVGVAALYNEYGNVVVLDALRGRWRVDELTTRMVDLIERYRHNAAKLGVEQGTIWEAIKDSFFAKMRARGLTIAIDHSLRPMTDKRIRARPLQAWMQSGRLTFPTGQPWMDQIRSELLRFDAGVHDDAVDAFAWLVRMLEKEARPDIDMLRRSRDAFAVDRDKFVDSYMRDRRRNKAVHKRFMAS